MCVLSLVSFFIYLWTYFVKHPRQRWTNLKTFWAGNRGLQGWRSSVASNFRGSQLVPRGLNLLGMLGDCLGCTGPLIKNFNLCLLWRCVVGCLHLVLLMEVGPFMTGPTEPTSRVQGEGAERVSWITLRSQQSVLGETCGHGMGPKTPLPLGFVLFVSASFSNQKDGSWARFQPAMLASDDFVEEVISCWGIGTRFSQLAETITPSASPRDATDIRLVEDAMEELAERVWGMHGFSLTLMGSCLSGTDILKQFGQSDTVETMHWENLGTILRYPCKNGGLFWARWRPIFGFRRWHWEEKRLNFVTATWSWIGKLCPYKATLAMTWWHIQRWKGQQIQNGGMTCAQSFTCGILGLKMLWRLWSVYARHLMVILWRPWFAGSGRSILVLPRIPLAWCCSSI